MFIKRSAFLTILPLLLAMLICRAGLCSVETEIGGKLEKARGLITAGAEKADYGLYIQAKSLLDEAESKVRYVSGAEKKALAMVSIAYLYSQMRNKYTKSYFDAGQWSQTQSDKSKKADKPYAKNDWTSLAESARCLEGAVREAAAISPPEDAGVFFLLAAIGYDSLRVQAKAGMGPLDMDSLYGKAKRYFTKAYDTRYPHFNLSELVEYYNAMPSINRVPLMSEKDVVALTREVLKMYSSSGINIYTALLFEFKENSLMVNEPKE